jgi:hypothetical protein
LGARIRQQHGVAVAQKHVSRAEHSGAIACYSMQQDDCVSITGSGAKGPGAKNGTVACRNLDLLEEGPTLSGNCSGLLFVIRCERQARRVEGTFGRDDACDGTDGEPDGCDARGPKQTYS